jgi:diguanylate cyclase (GGDEF)-like protein/PAS domain S-box-containing protein
VEEVAMSNEEGHPVSEGLRLTNGELVTLKEEPGKKLVELSRAVDDFEQIQNSLQSPLLVLERHGRLRRFNPIAGRLLGLTGTSIGSPLTVAMGPEVGERLTAKAERAMAQQKAQAMRLGVGSRRFVARFTAAAATETVAVLFHDVTALTRRSEKLRRSEQRLRQSKQQMETILNTIASHAALVDGSGRIVMVNAAWRRFAEANGFQGSRYGVGTNYLRICDVAVSEEGVQEFREGLRKVLAGKMGTFSMEYSCNGPREQRWFRCTIAGVADKGERGAVVLHDDISEQRRPEARADHSQAPRQAGSSTFVLDGAGRITWVNEAFAVETGWGQEIAGKGVEHLGAEAGTVLREAVQQCKERREEWSGEVRQRRRDGVEYMARQTVMPVSCAEGEVTHFVVMQEDPARTRASREQMRHMAERDSLTGLWNRKTLIERLTAAIERRRWVGGQLGVLFLDMDRFKNTNEMVGHLVGDRILVEAAQRLKAGLRERDGLARFGGDEFVIYVENVSDRSGVTQVVERLMAGFSRPFDADGRSVAITASIGVAMWPEDAETAEGLLRSADLAMYRAKAEGRRGYRFYDAHLEAEINERVSVERELSRAIGTRDLWVAYQPQWDLRSGDVVGAESLLRWDQAKGVPIGRVIEIAEESGTILQIGQWIIREAIQQLSQWHAQGYPLQISVNLSAVQFHKQDVFGMVMDLLNARKLPPSYLRVEITESVLLNRSSRVTETLHALHGVGVGVVLDDFGTGYSSLSYLQNFPIDMVKIDASFLRGVGRSSQDEAIVRGIVQLAHSLGQRVVAEGVETEEQLEFLKVLGCDYAQGYLLARPLTAADFDGLLGMPKVAAVQA